jgi:cellulose synthase/poly-beta-1,6-N-acetylglucosamine synthase-like glycosyltransferase
MTLDIIVHRVYFFFESGVIFYVFMINTIYFFLTAVAFFTMRRHHAPLNEAECASLAESPLLPAISLIVPAHNEEMSVEESVGGMLHLRYPLYEVIVVNDGSKDATMQKLTDKFRLFKSGRAAEGPLQTKPIRHIYESRDPIPLVVIDKENGGKADAINAGLQVARSPLVMVVDCDSLIDRDALLNMAKPFLEDPERTIAVGGTVRSVNDCGERLRCGARHGAEDYHIVVVARQFPGCRIPACVFRRPCRLQPGQRVDDYFGRLGHVPPRCGNGGWGI